jgi:hypothetical protein
LNPISHPPEPTARVIGEKQKTANHQECLGEG